MGIPISEINQTKSPGQFNFTVEKFSQTDINSWLLYADAFHRAKWVIKQVASTNGYFPNFQPLQVDGGTHDIKLEFASEINMNQVN